MTQQELYWYEKRLYLQADEKEREIRGRYAWLLSRSPCYNHLTEEQRRNAESRERERRWSLESSCRQEVEFARLTILEPILDQPKKERLKQLREQKKQQEEENKRRRLEEEQQRIKAERERIEREEKERRLESRRTAAAARKAKQEAIERERQRELDEERLREAEQREKAKTAMKWMIGLMVVAVIVVLIVSFWDNIIAFVKTVLGIFFVIGLIAVFASD